MRILITGGGGFIGSHLADRLLDRGDEVCVIDNFATGRRDNLVSHPGLTLVEGTIADQALVDRTFDAFEPDQVVHAAAAYKDPTDWTEDVRTNVLGTCHIVTATRRVGAKRLVYFQTGALLRTEAAGTTDPAGAPARPAAAAMQSVKRPAKITSPSRVWTLFRSGWPTAMVRATSAGRYRRSSAG